MPSITISQSAMPEEAAAIAAAVLRFGQDTAIAAPEELPAMNPWLKTALTEGVSAKEPFGPGQPFGTL